MNPNSHVPWRQSRDFSDGCRIQVFEIADDDLAIERFESLNQGRKPVQIRPLVRRLRPFRFVRESLEFFQRYEARKDAALTDNVRRRHMVGNAVDPCPQGAAAIVPLKTPPQLEVNILAQVAAFVRIRFVGPREPFERRSEAIRRIGVQRILIRVPRRDG